MPDQYWPTTPPETPKLTWDQGDTFGQTAINGYWGAVVHGQIIMPQGYGQSTPSSMITSGWILSYNLKSSVPAKVAELTKPTTTNTATILPK